LFSKTRLFLKPFLLSPFLAESAGLGPFPGIKPLGGLFFPFPLSGELAATRTFPLPFLIHAFSHDLTASSFLQAFSLSRCSGPFQLAAIFFPFSGGRGRVLLLRSRIKFLKEDTEVLRFPFLRDTSFLDRSGGFVSLSAQPSSPPRVLDRPLLLGQEKWFLSPFFKRGFLLNLETSDIPYDLLYFFPDWHFNTFPRWLGFTCASLEISVKGSFPPLLLASSFFFFLQLHRCDIPP